MNFVFALVFCSLVASGNAAFTTATIPVLDIKVSSTNMVFTCVITEPITTSATHGKVSINKDGAADSFKGDAETDYTVADVSTTGVTASFTKTRTTAATDDGSYTCKIQDATSTAVDSASSVAVVYYSSSSAQVVSSVAMMAACVLMSSIKAWY